MFDNETLPLIPMLVLLVALAAWTHPLAGQEYERGEDWKPALADTEVMVLENGFAIGGYDPVAYFELDEPTLGREEISLEWRGATWLFASEEHRALFAADPERYAPQYGGWCAYGVSGHGDVPGYGAQSRPQDSWSIVEGKLYFNWSPKVVEWFLADQEELIPAADRYWPDVSEAIRNGEPVHWQDVPDRDS